MKKIKFSLIILILIPKFLIAEVPHSFNAGEAVSASKFNDNFNYLANLVSDGKYNGLMICTDFGYSKDLDNQLLVFINCLSSDITILGSMTNVHSSLSGGPQNPNYGAVTASKIVSEGWVMINSYGLAAGTAGSTNFKERFVFVKAK